MIQFHDNMKTIVVWLGRENYQRLTECVNDKDWHECDIALPTKLNILVTWYNIEVTYNLYMMIHNEMSWWSVGSRFNWLSFVFHLDYISNWLSNLTFYKSACHYAQFRKWVNLMATTCSYSNKEPQVCSPALFRNQDNSKIKVIISYWHLGL